MLLLSIAHSQDLIKVDSQRDKDGKADKHHVATRTESNVLVELVEVAVLKTHIATFENSQVSRASEDCNR